VRDPGLEASFFASDPRTVGEVGVNAAVLSLVLACGSPGEAERIPLRAVVRVPRGADFGLVPRIRGQISDLRVVLVERVTDPLEATARGCLARADQIARENDARVVVWWEFISGTGGSTLAVSVSDVASKRLLLRALPVPASDAASNAPLGSSTLEEAALVVRTALQAIDAGESIGLDREVALAPSPLFDRSPPDVPSAVVDASAIDRSSAAWSATLGLAITVDGASPHGQEGMTAGLHLDSGAIWASLTVEAYLPARLQDAQATIELNRYAARTAIGLVNRGASITWRVAVRAGGALIRRRTLSTAANVRPTPARSTLAPELGPQIDLVVHLGSRGPFILFTIGADVVLGAPRFAYEDSGGILSAHASWPIEPNAAVSLGTVL
jgi:hypothetical protein